jgi:hypothetical protein
VRASFLASDRTYGARPIGPRAWNARNAERPASSSFRKRTGAHFTKATKMFVSI